MYSIARRHPLFCIHALACSVCVRARARDAAWGCSPDVIWQQKEELTVGTRVKNTTITLPTGDGHLILPLDLNVRNLADVPGGPRNKDTDDEEVSVVRLEG